MRSGSGVHRNGLRKARIAVPPGVGDTYWALSKIADWKRKNKIEHLTLCVQKSKLARALDWHRMVSFIDATEEFAFHPDQMSLENGWSNKIAGVDLVFWPNAIIDKGFHLREWLPQYELDMEFDIRLPDISRSEEQRLAIGQPLIYASSIGPGRAWLPSVTAEFWVEVIEQAHEQTGKVPVLIGSKWDEPVRDRIFAACPDLPCHDLVAQTSLPEVFAIIQEAHSLTGLICGMTIMANHFRTPCVALAPDKFLHGFLTSWIKPGTPYTVYQHGTMPAPDQIMREVCSLAERKGQSQ